MNSKILLLFIFTILFSVHFVSAEIDLRLTGSIADVSSIFYTETSSTSLNGYDGNDVIAPGHFPSGNSSRFYSTVSGNQLAIDSWSLASVPHTLNLTFELSPAQTGTLNLAWTFSNADYDAVLYSCTDATCTSSTSLGDMETISSTSVLISGIAVYFKIIVSATPVVIVPGGGGCSSTGCASASTIACGNSYTDNCGTSCGKGTQCGSGFSCVNNNCQLNSCVAKTCLQLGVSCGTVDDGCGNTLSCGAACVQQCTPACSGGFSCVAGSCQLTTPQTCLPACSSGYSCVAGVCVQGQAPPNNVIPLNLPAGSSASANCVKSFICGEWGECKVSYALSDLITGGQLSGERKRTCTDKNNCLVNFEQKENCTLKEEVEVRKKLWCGQEYTEIVSKTTSKVIARIKVLPNGKAANINFNVGGEGTCAYCSDGIKNYDEEGVDCGGPNCVSCTASKLKRTGVFLAGTLYGVLLPFLMLFVFLGLLTYTVQFIFQYTARTAENWILRQYANWKKEGYDAFVLDDNVKHLKRRL